MQIVFISGNHFFSRLIRAIFEIFLMPSSIIGINKAFFFKTIAETRLVVTGISAKLTLPYIPFFSI